MKPSPLCVALVTSLLFLSLPTFAAENLLINGGFEEGLTGWNDAWSREPAVRADLVADRVHGGKNAVRIEHTGGKDWSLMQAQRLNVQSGEIYEIDAWAQLEGQGTANVSVILYDAQNNALDWSFGARSSGATDGWRRLQSRFIIPTGTSTITPRMIGNGPATVWLDDYALHRAGSLDDLRSADLPNQVKASNDLLEVTFHTDDATFTLHDRRTEYTWRQKPQTAVVVLEAKQVAGGLDLRLLDPATMIEITATVRLDGEEMLVELSGIGELTRTLAFPHPFISDEARSGDFLVLPVNEGISYPVADETLQAMHHYLYGGHGLCMGFWGVTGGEDGLMAIVETPDDAAVRVLRLDGRLCLAPEWQSQRGQFGPARRIRYVALGRGGYVAMCKRYRRYSKEIGLFKTLAEKRKENPDVDRLIGAVNVWCWEQEPVAMCQELKALGIDRILWSNRSKPEAIRQLNAMGVLTSRYDIYQDAMNPANFPKLRWVHGDWTSEAWPDDLNLDEHGQWRPGWRVEGKDGRWYPCGVLCDRQAPDYARRRIPAELETHDYRCRFIDTTTASPWRECYHPDHPMTRSESRHWKMELLRVVSDECGLVTGSETGHEAAVPHVHYFEGMLSLGPYRVPDAGRRMIEAWDEVPERVAKFQTGHFYRLPLWELVYHDCVVAQWYWGDYNNKLPSLWDRRDLFNALYGTPPMFMFNREIWRENRDRFVRSYQTAAPVARATGYSEMLSHAWLTPDHSVQQTRFANGMTVTVNLGKSPFFMPNGDALKPLGYHVQEK